MNRHLLACLVVGALALFMAQGASAQVVFKWVDDRGVTHYGENPPTGRNATPVDITPSGSEREPGSPPECHTVQCQYDRLRTNRTQDEAQPPLAHGRGAREGKRAHGMSFETYRNLQTGMPEGEVLLRAGPPDYHSNQFLSSGYLGKTWYYYPTVSDPFTTVIQISGGQVFSLDRIRQF